MSTVRFKVSTGVCGESIVSEECEVRHSVDRAFAVFDCDFVSQYTRHIRQAGQGKISFTIPSRDRATLALRQAGAFNPQALGGLSVSIHDPRGHDSSGSAYRLSSITPPPRTRINYLAHQPPPSRHP